MSAWSRWRARNPGVAIWQLLWWDALWKPISWLATFLLYRVRNFHADRIPKSGPVLLICNHQSYLDLVTIGVGIHHRHYHSMAKAPLFSNPFFGWFIKALNAFPVEQGKGDVKSLRHAIDLLKHGHLVLIFPEGRRTPDGRIQPFSPGLMLLIKRAKPTVVPMAVDGPFDVWPVHRSAPRLHGRIGAMCGHPIPAEQLLDMDAQQAMDHLTDRVEALRIDLRHKLRAASKGKYPTDPGGDTPQLDPMEPDVTAGLQ